MLAKARILKSKQIFKRNNILISKFMNSFPSYAASILDQCHDVLKSSQVH